MPVQAGHLGGGTAAVPSPGAAAKAPRGTVVIEEDRCKGCELCIPACPVGVLQMSSRRNAKGFLLPELLDGCTGCSACQIICPDFVFEVYRFPLDKEAA